MQDKIDYLAFIEALKESKAITDEIGIITESELNTELMLKLLETPYLLDYNEEEETLYYKDSEEGELKSIPDFSSGVIRNADWLSKYLPIPAFDLDENGQREVLAENEACYTCCCIGAIVGSDYKEEIKEFINKYNLEEGRTEDGQTFRSLLAEFKEYNSTLIRIIISAANIQLLATKKTGGILNLKELNDEETLKLDVLNLKIKAINVKYTLNELSPEKLKTYTKIERLQVIDKKDKEIEKVINNSDIKTIYRISRLTIDCIPPISERRIYKAANKEAMLLKERNNLSDFEYQRVRRLLIRKGKRVRLNQIANECLASYKESPKTFILPLKR